MSSFGELLREARIRPGLTQEELAQEVDVTDGYICKLEKGDSTSPSRKVALKLVNALGISDPVERNNFLIAAGVFNKEDLEGFALVKVAGGQKVGPGQQPIATANSRLANPAMEIPDGLLGPIGEEVERLIAAECLTEEEERDVAEAIFESTKRYLKLIKKQRGK